jgi:hypothetical protein
MVCTTNPCSNPISYTQKSMTLINGYSILDLTGKGTALFNSLNVKLVNGILNNDGSTSAGPTFLRIWGTLDNNIIPTLANSLGVFFDTNLIPSFVKEGTSANRLSNSYYCTAKSDGGEVNTNCEFRKGSSFAVSSKPTNVWKFHNLVKIKYTLSSSFK